MKPYASLRVVALVCAATSSFVCPAQSAFHGPINVHASRVIAFDDRGGAGGGIFAPTNALGAPGTASVHSLGLGGSLTLGFDVVIQDRPGADLVVFENPFTSSSSPWETFAEVFYVEVSSNGVDFARVPSRYTGPQVDPGPFSFIHSGYYSGLGGSFATRSGAGSSRDVVATGGDPIDLASLQSHPLVQSGVVDLQAITVVRLVDVQSGIDADSQGTLIRDPGSGSADIDAVTVLHYAADPAPNAPTVELSVPASGALVMTIGDPDGLLDITSLRTTLWGIEIPAGDLLSVLQVQSLTASSVTFAAPSGLPASIPLRLTASVRDAAGQSGGAGATRE